SWELFTYRNIKIFHQPGHLQQERFPDLAEKYLYSIKTIQNILKLPPFTDTLYVVYYTGFGQGREMTGREYPFADSGVIYFWQPSFLGPTLMQYLLPRWVPDEPKHVFLKHGLISLFDFSGQNYHEYTMRFIENNKFEPLKELAVDTVINSDIERNQSSEAASFVAFILANYGEEHLKMMYKSALPFDRMVQEMFMMPVDSLESRWLEFVKQNFPPDTTGQK
ncbi:MAG: hypothetical protein ACOYVF_01115, partial [Candidatus Zixiibacteriota bacterium]